ncbi:MAG: exodeoxyribonuclease V subunit gamma [Actinobacteria bacterium]|nr:exodeoxyribonuclease V subunit gamma [Actinomycetota bacterium]
MPNVVTTSFGEASIEALVDEIRLMQGENRLAPVEVITASTNEALAVRRRLAHHAALAAVSFTTLGRLANRQVLSSSDQKIPMLSGVALDFAVRSAMRDGSSRLSAVSRHEASVRAVRRSYLDLRSLGTDAMDSLVAKHGGHDTIALAGSIRAKTAGLLDQVDVLERAATLPAPAGLAGVIWFLPTGASPAERRYLEALFQSLPTTALIGLSGDREVDEALTQTLSSWIPGIHAIADEEDFTFHAAEVISAATQSVEVAAVVRRVSGLVHAGLRFDQIAITYPDRGPYARLLEEALVEAKIPHFGLANRSLAMVPAGRVLIGLLDAAQDNWSRAEVMDWMTSCTLKDQNGELPRAQMDKISRAAMVTGSADQWSRNLEAFAQDQDLRSQDYERGAASRVAAERNAAHARRLKVFIANLSERFPGDDEEIRSWQDWLQALSSALKDFLDLSEEREEDALAREEVEVAIDQLRDAARFGADISFTELCSTLRSALSVSAPSSSRFGLGVALGSPRRLSGLSPDHLFVIGMTDSNFPARVGEDSVLPDRLRRDLDEHLALDLGSTLASRRELLRLICAMKPSTSSLTFSMPRGDQRSAAEQRPSRWLLEALVPIAQELDSSLVYGDQMFARELTKLKAGSTRDGRRFTMLASSLGGFAEQLGEPVGSEDWVVRALATRAREGKGERLALAAELLGEEAATELRAADAVIHGRLPGKLGPYLGVVSEDFGGKIVAAQTANPVSPTSLEEYAKCPRKYFFNHVLGISQDDRPEEQDAIPAYLKGSFIHDVLQQVVSAAMEKAGTNTVTVSTDELLETLKARADDFKERLGAVSDYEWEGLLENLSEELPRVLAIDGLTGPEPSLRPIEVEWGFGNDQLKRFPYPLGDGQDLYFQGRADRIDERLDAQGNRVGLVASDYKSGAQKNLLKARKGLQTDPTARGQRLQLLGYAEATFELIAGGKSSEALTSRYLIVSPEQSDVDNEKRVVEIAITDDSRERFRDVLKILTGGIRAGLFPMVPGDLEKLGQNQQNLNCDYCAFNSICPRSRRSVALRVANTYLREPKGGDLGLSDEQSKTLGQLVGLFTTDFHLPITPGEGAEDDD